MLVDKQTCVISLFLSLSSLCLCVRVNIAITLKRCASWLAFGKLSGNPWHILMYRRKFLPIRCPWVTRRYGDDGSGLMMAGFRIIVLYCSPWPLFLLGGPCNILLCGGPRESIVPFSC